MLKRKIAPIIKDIEHIALPNPETIHLANGIPVHYINKGKLPIIKIEILFKASRPFEHKQLVARATARLLKEGTIRHTSSEIAEKIDFFGGTIDIPVNLDTTSISLFCISKYAADLIPLFAEIIFEPNFPEKELQTFIENNKQRLITDLAEADVRAYREITASIFGKDHPYGYNSTLETHDALTRDDLLYHYTRTYGTNNCTIFAAGEINEKILTLLDQNFGQTTRIVESIQPNLYYEMQPPTRQFIPHEGVQTAIRLARRTAGRDHSDTSGLFFLNTILGGYFASRLMTNIREEKGYTYNIYSSLDLMWKDGYCYIATEVGSEFVKDTTTQIYKEMEILRNEPVKEQELLMVRRYLMGSILSMVDGPFQTIELVRTYLAEDLTLTHFNQFIDTIKTIDSNRLLELANQYLDPKDWWEIKVGQE